MRQMIDIVVYTIFSLISENYTPNTLKSVVLFHSAVLHGNNCSILKLYTVYKKSQINCSIHKYIYKKFFSIHISKSVLEYHRITSAKCINAGLVSVRIYLASVKSSHCIYFVKMA